MTPLMLVAIALMVLFGLAALLVLLSANDTAAERDDLAEQLEALKADAERRRRAREACAQMRRGQ